MSDRSSTIGDWVQIVAIVVAGSWGVYQFIYIEQIKPRSLDTLINVSLELSHIGKSALGTPERQIDIVQLTITARNDSDRRAYVGASYYEVLGRKFSLKENPYKFVPREVQEILNLKDNYIDSSGKSIKSELLQIGTAYNAESWFEPKEIRKVSRIIYVPKDEFMQFESNVYLLSTGDLAKRKFRHVVNERLEIQWEVTENGNEWYPLSSKEGREIIRNDLDVGFETIIYAY